MKKKISLVLALGLAMASVGLAKDGIWTTKADMPTARWILSTSVVDGKIYAIGGGSRYGQGALRTVEEYNPVTDTWTTKSEMPTARQCPSASVVNGKIYVIGGGETSGANYSGTEAFSTVEEYDPATNTWTTKSEMSTARFGHSTSAVGGRIYVIGGSPSCPWCGSILTLEVYDPATDTWTQKGNIPRPIITASTSVVNGKIYAIGGEGTGSRVDEYDPVTDTWTRKADMPSNRTDLSSCVMGGKIYVIGGDGTGIVATVEVYDPTMNTWTTAPEMPTARTGVRTSMVNGKIYAIGGLTAWGAAAHGTVEEYGPYPLVVDFNGNGIFDINDLVNIIENWETDDPLCDIAPQPWGDGIVDKNDLEVFMSYWGQEVNDSTLIAHWPLDETEGIIAYDSTGIYDGIVYGEPTWQPEVGVVDGALEFDGINDYISTPFVLDPHTSSFSVFAWIKGGLPGQVILSQADGVNWLLTDSLDGCLMTELRSIGGRSEQPPLISSALITDGGWHRIGFVWDGTNRILYVDDFEVASDTQSHLIGSEGGLYIGTGNNMETGTFWKGLIDDVRIYDRVVTP